MNTRPFFFVEGGVKGTILWVGGGGEERSLKVENAVRKKRC